MSKCDELTAYIEAYPGKTARELETAVPGAVGLLGHLERKGLVRSQKTGAAIVPAGRSRKETLRTVKEFYPQSQHREAAPAAKATTFDPDSHIGILGELTLTQALSLRAYLNEVFK